MTAATSLKQLQSQIHFRYDNLSGRLQQVARYILENQNSIAFNTIATIAQEANVPPSTIIRFAHQFGYSGFNEMKQLFRQNVIEETSDYTDRLRISRKLKGKEGQKETPEQILHEFTHHSSVALQKLAATTSSKDLDKATKLLMKADNIYIVGMGRSFGVASYFTYALNRLNCNAFLVNGLGGMFDDQLEMIQSKDILVTISFSPYAEEAIATSKSTASQGIKQIAITDQHISPLAAHSDVCFVVKEARVIDAFRSLSATQCLVQSLSLALAFQETKEAKRPRQV